MGNEVDILENDLLSYDTKLLPLLLSDKTRQRNGQKQGNIIWATDNYAHLGSGYGEWDQISADAVSGDNGTVLKPRIKKSKAEQEHRSRDKAEVFTAAWICNKQNNLIDIAWFAADESPFNTETDNGWITKTARIAFPEGKTWQDYVKDTRLEMACGEAPYLVSRYDVVTGNEIAVQDRIGMLDRKLRIVGENTSNEEEWFQWAVIAFQSIYGFEWQGDNLLLAREALIYTFFDFYSDRFSRLPSKLQTRKIAEIVSWNLWQMDGLKGVIPGSCHDDIKEEYDLFGGCSSKKTECPGCKDDDISKHNGIYCLVKDWDKGTTIRFIDMLK